MVRTRSTTMCMWPIKLDLIWKIQVPWRTHWLWNGPPTQMVWWRGQNSASSTSGGWRNLACHLNFHRCTIESILSGCITAWYGNCTAHTRRSLQRVVRSTQHITGGKLPALHDTYSTRWAPTALDVTGRPKRSKTSSTRAMTCSPRYHPEDEVSTGAAVPERLKNRFYMKAIRLK
jgi:hypothetical protein